MKKGGEATLEVNLSAFAPWHETKKSDLLP
jgi:hypothetical protein